MTSRAEEATEERAPGLWRNADFVKFWLATNVSLLGSHLSMLAFPLLAVLTLQAGPAQMGALGATRTAAAVLVGPFAGVFVDRMRRRPILVGTEVGLALMTFSVPAAATLGVLDFGLLYVVQFLSGTLTIFGEVAGMAFLPSLVARAQLVSANSKVQASNAAVSVAGPGLAGLLVQWLGAPLVIVFDGVSFLLSAACVWMIRGGGPEPRPDSAEKRRSVWAEIGEGLRFVYGHRLLRPMAHSIALHFLFSGMVYTVFVLYAVRERGLAPAALGVVMAALGPGFMFGALVAPRAARRFGVGRVMTWATLMASAGTFLMAAADGPATSVVLVFVAAHLLWGCGVQLHGVNFVSLRQAVTPHALQGRMNASFRFVNLFAATLGALAAGWLGERAGLRATLAVAACGLLLPFLRLLLSPLRSLRELPEEAVSD